MKDLLFPLRRLHGNLYEERQKREKSKSIAKKIQLAKPETVLFIITPTHGNMGDHAIAEAAINVLRDLQMDYLEITTNELQLLSHYNKLGVMNGRPILVNGGGNLGTLWPEVEKLFRRVIQSAPKSPIICLPNTMFYEQSAEGEQDLQKSREIYNAHNNLLLCAREKISFACMSENYNNVVLIPDMALMLNKCKNVSERSGCLLCLRRDIERTLTDKDTAEVKNQAVMLFGENIKESDMNINRSVPIEQRDNALAEKYDEFCSAELVITDRLHGMIFAAITGTPCIVVNSKSPKVKGCYEWIKELGYIRFAEKTEQISQIYNQLPRKEYSYDNSYLMPYYDRLRELITKMFKEVN